MQDPVSGGTDNENPHGIGSSLWQIQKEEFCLGYGERETAPGEPG